MARKSKTPSARYMEQAQQAHELVLGGMGYRQIAEKLGVSLGTVQNRLKLYREEVSAPKLEDLRNRQLARIEMGIRALWPMYLKADKDAINGMVALMKREADLLGLNAATAFKVEATINTRETDASEVQKMMDEWFAQNGKTIPGEVVHRKRPTVEPDPIQYTAPVTTPDEFAVEPDATEELDIEPEHIEPAPRPRRKRGQPIPNPAAQFLRDSDDD